VIHEAVEASQVIVWGAVISVGLLCACAAWLAVAIGYAVGHHIASRFHRRRELQRIEAYANHPLAHRLHSPDRKEKP
jgi:sterol desaturase/sphingolipid hydroxylase (fatty acid hydroxylase superfamily)